LHPTQGGNRRQTDYRGCACKCNAPRLGDEVLQRVVGVTDDGSSGPITVATVGATDSKQLIAKFSQARLAYYQGLQTFAAFGSVWTTPRAGRAAGRARDGRATVIATMQRRTVAAGSDLIYQTRRWATAIHMTASFRGAATRRPG